MKIKRRICILGTSPLGARLSEREERMTSMKVKENDSLCQKKIRHSKQVCKITEKLLAFVGDTIFAKMDQLCILTQETLG